MTTATPQGAAPALTLGMEWSEGDAADELLERFMKTTDADKPSDNEGSDETTERTKPAPKAPAKSPAEEEPEDDDEESDEEQEGDDNAEGDDDEGTDDEKKSYADENTTYVKVKVGDEEHEVPVSKLTRLYGQEAALTKKSMEAAELRKTAEADMQRNALATQALMARAEERWKPYAQIDFQLLASQVGREGGLSQEEYVALRQQAQAAYEEREFLGKHLDGFATAVRERTQAQKVEQAREALKVLSSSPEQGGIEGWSQKLYDDIRAFGATYGIPVESINNAVDPWAIRLMHDAMQYARIKQKTGDTVKTVKAKKGPKKIVKTTNSPAEERNSAPGRPSKAMKTLQLTGDTEDAAEALLARWSSKDD
jgi:hypothetical protein